MKLHQDTTLCKDFKVAKVFVKEDLTKELPRSMNFKFQGKDTLVDFSYPWIPSKCTTCGKWGNLEMVCKQKIAEENGNMIVSQENANEGTMMASKDCSLEGGKDTDVGKEKSSSETDQETKVMAVTEVQEIAEKVAETKERIGGEEVNESEAITGTESDLQEGKDWLTPTKVSKTPEKKKDQDLGEGSIISNSRFALLAPEDAKDGDILQQET